MSRSWIVDGNLICTPHLVKQADASGESVRDRLVHYTTAVNIAAGQLIGGGRWTFPVPRRQGSDARLRFR